MSNFGKPLDQIKVKSNMQFVYFDNERNAAIRVDAWGEEVAVHANKDENSMMFLIQWLAVDRSCKNVEFVFLKSKVDLQLINFKKQM